MSVKKYIVSANQILSSIESSINDNIENKNIVRELMLGIENNVWTVLEDDCMEFISEDWDYIGD